MGYHIEILCLFTTIILYSVYCPSLYFILFLYSFHLFVSLSSKPSNTVIHLIQTFTHFFIAKTYYHTLFHNQIQPNSLLIWGLLEIFISLSRFWKCYFFRFDCEQNIEQTGLLFWVSNKYTKLLDTLN